MRSPPTLTALACASLALIAAGCSTTGRTELRVAMPASPAVRLEACFARVFPTYPPGDITVGAIRRQFAEARALDAIKSRCGMDAVAWIRAVDATYGR